MAGIAPEAGLGVVGIREPFSATWFGDGLLRGHSNETLCNRL